MKRPWRGPTARLACTGASLVLTLAAPVLAQTSLPRLEAVVPRLESYPVLSPDARQLVYSSGRGFALNLFRLDLATGRETNLTNHPAIDTNPHWSPSGEWIVFASSRGGSLDLYVVRPDGSDVRRITNGGSTSIAYGRPSFSWDGTRIVANRSVRGVTDMVIIDFPGGAEAGLENR